jgi:hypothetical protein
MDKDALFRSAQTYAEQALPELSQLLDASEETLYAALVARTDETIKGSPVPVGDNETNLRDGYSNPFGRLLDADILTRDTETLSLGRRLFRRWNLVLHDFACNPSKSDTDLRDRLMNAITDKTSGGVAIVAAVLASLGVGPAVAAILAALAIKLILVPAADEVCKAWSASINGSPQSKTDSQGAAA